MKRRNRKTASFQERSEAPRNKSSSATPVLTGAIPRIAALLLPLVGLAWTGESNAETRSLLEARHDRVVLQQWDLSCGAAALATILKYQYDEPVTEREIALQIMQRKEYLANPSIVRARQGYSLLDLQRVVEGRNYKGIGLGNLSLNDLVERAPMIVPMKFAGYNHFVVFRGLYRGQVVLADPAWGNRTMAIGAFERAWLEHPNMGRTGFHVAPRDDSKPANRLAPTAKDLLLAYVYPEEEGDDDAVRGPQQSGAVLLADAVLDVPVAGLVEPTPDQPPAAQPPEVVRPEQDITTVANAGNSTGHVGHSIGSTLMTGINAGASSSTLVQSSADPGVDISNGQQAVAAAATQTVSTSSQEAVAEAAQTASTSSKDTVSSAKDAVTQVASTTTQAATGSGKDTSGTDATSSVTDTVAAATTTSKELANSTTANTATVTAAAPAKEVTSKGQDAVAAATQTASTSNGTSSKDSRPNSASSKDTASSAKDAVTQVAATTNTATNTQTASVSRKERSGGDATSSVNDNAGAASSKESPNTATTATAAKSAKEATSNGREAVDATAQTASTSNSAGSKDSTSNSTSSKGTSSKGTSGKDTASSAKDAVTQAATTQTATNTQAATGSRQEAPGTDATSSVNDTAGAASTESTDNKASTATATSGHSISGATLRNATAPVQPPLGR